MHNHIASTVSLAKATLMSLDRAKENTVLPTRTVELMLNTLIDLGERDNPTARRIENASTSFVASRINGVEGR